ncbi:rhomboid family intramembrane serine protease [Paraflavitalea speifideaquila]|uniref:rhomboid family intramembrane serine protease n=1 Tax=Paraflavitalea speifideaquila TaxID=3076558 RepID=UPI003CCD90DA
MVTGIIIFLLIVTNMLMSWKGFGNEVFFDRFKFNVDGILIYRQYERLITSGFFACQLAAPDLQYVCLVFFSGSLSIVLDWWGFLIVYFMGLVGGNLLSLFIHRHSGDYSSMGASGAVSG